eukprot:6492188-Amphidinium_carterae.2
MIDNCYAIVLPTRWPEMATTPSIACCSSSVQIFCFFRNYLLIELVRSFLFFYYFVFSTDFSRNVSRNLRSDEDKTHLQGRYIALKQRSGTEAK